MSTPDWAFGIELKAHLLPFKIIVMFRKNMGMSKGQWDQVEETDIEIFLEEELWVKDKFKVWKEEKDAEMRVKMAQSGR